MNKISKILILAILLIGLGVGVFLVQKQQIFKSKASTGINSGLSVYSPDGEDAVKYVGDNTYQSSSKNVRVSLKSLQQLIQP